MREILDAIDSAPPALLGAAAIALLALLCAIEWGIARRRYELAQEYLQGYRFGYQDGRAGRIPIVALPHTDAYALVDVDVPAAFTKAWPR
jgi:hypothetical protein